MFTDHESMCLRHAWHHVLPNLPRGTGAVYVLDNASNNKKIEDGLGGRTSEEIQDWINECDIDPERFQTYCAEKSEGRRPR